MIQITHTVRNDNPSTIFNDHPFYGEGWDDARDGEPLFPDAAVEYAAGWRGWYAAKEALARILDEARQERS
jgi:hypothetical protein